MNIITIRLKLQEVSKKLRLMLGAIEYKSLLRLETKIEQVRSDVTQLALAHQNNKDVELASVLIEANPELQELKAIKKHYRKADPTQTVRDLVIGTRKELAQYMTDVDKIVKRKAGVNETYLEKCKYQVELARLEIAGGSVLENSFEDYEERKKLVEKIDELMAASDYRNQSNITFMDYYRNQAELYSLNLILENYTKEASKFKPECTILKTTRVWEYIGVGEEPVKIQIEKLTEQNDRFKNVPEVAGLIHKVFLLDSQK